MVAGSTLRGSDRWQTRTDRTALRKCRRNADGACDSGGSARPVLQHAGNGFNVQLPPVPDRIFTTEPARALDPATPAGLMRATSPPIWHAGFRQRHLWCWRTMRGSAPARRALDRLRRQRRDRLCHHRQRHDPLRGSGYRWNAGDLFILPGGEPALHTAGHGMRCCGSSPTSRNWRSRTCGRRRCAHPPNSCTTAPMRSRGRSISSTRWVARRDRRIRADLLRRTAGKPRATSCRP